MSHLKDVHKSVNSQSQLKSHFNKHQHRVEIRHEAEHAKELKKLPLNLMKFFSLGTDKQKIFADRKNKEAFVQRFSRKSLQC